MALGEIVFSPYAPADYLAISISVEPNHRGCGVGSTMLAHLESEAEKRGYRGLIATIPEAASGP